MHPCVPHEVCCCSTWPVYGCERNVSFVVACLAVAACTYSMHRSYCSGLVWYLLISLCGAVFEQPF